MPLSTGAKVGIGIGLGVLVIGGLSLAGYFMFRKPSKSEGKKGDKKTVEAGESATPPPKQTTQAEEGKGHGAVIRGIRAGATQTTEATQGRG